MARYKDWKPGEVRIDCKVVDEKGGRIETYLPKLTPEDGVAFNALMIECAITPVDERPCELSKAVVRAWKRILKKRKAEEEAKKGKGHARKK
ncbi:MAG: hypothetical protein GWN58_32725 [Anaerolineae bacterium]|nr:hypothetical protein [Thermoplasmata archaeon]NIV34040.1 hypothetical protein [Anaerolineae bacterium]NIY05891.1 hypothetical protein [Thermoplasmata archaeon]